MLVSHAVSITWRLQQAGVSGDPTQWALHAARGALGRFPQGESAGLGSCWRQAFRGPWLRSLLCTAGRLTCSDLVSQGG